LDSSDFWMQACVDGQIGQIVTPLQANSANNVPWNNTVVIFTSDHGDYGGSHNLHQKGGALYDESINVPLYVSFPGQRQSSTAPMPRNFVCSSVDIVPLVYTLALGNNSWRTNPVDIVAYRNGRESILDAIYSPSTATQRRTAPGIPCVGDTSIDQPYILHTTDEFPGAGGSPSHAIAFRTVDVTLTTPPAGTGTYGGGKLGIYSFWASCATTPVADPSSGFYPQYEFYDYTTISTAYPSGNYAETGNQGPSSVSAESGETTLSTRAQGYYDSFTSTSVQDELYSVPCALESAYSAALSAYLAYIGCSGSCSG
jgi:hypothetical protein